VRLLNVLLATAYAALGLWVGLWLTFASGFVCDGNSCSSSGNWVDTGEGWQWSLMSSLGLASLPVVILAIALTYKSLRIGVVFVGLHLALLAVALPLAGQVPNWSYGFVAAWFVLVALVAIGFAVTRRLVNARSSGELGTPANRFA
jgi:hypothetical protein